MERRQRHCSTPMRKKRDCDKLGVMRDKVLMPSSRMLACIRLTGQLGRRGDEVSWHRSSRQAAMVVVEMAFAREEENGIRGGGGGPTGAMWQGEVGVLRSVQLRQPASSDPSTPDTGRRAWPLKTEEVEL
jgi:hypothetical protein